jgi:hypothetical protein
MPYRQMYIMKIENNQIRISGRTPAMDLIKDLKEGSRLAVRITGRSGDRHAVLDIGGRRVNAEFLHGVPKSGSLFLVLDRVAKGTLFFSIAEGSSKEGLIGELNKFTIFTLTDLSKSINELRLYLKEGIYSIFSLNKALIKFTGFIEEEKKFEKIVNLLNKMLSRGADYKDLILIAALINHGKNPASYLFYVILSRMFPGYKQIFEKNDINKKIENFLDFLNKSFTESDKDDKIDTIKTILDLCFNKSEKNNLLHGTLIFFEEKKFKLCRYILNENNIILSLDLSYIGNIDILIKQEKSFYFISFFCEKNESIPVLKSDIKLLESVLNSDKMIKTHFVFFNNKKSIEKIIEIISAIDLNYLFDAKV